MSWLSKALGIDQKKSGFRDDQTQSLREMQGLRPQVQGQLQRANGVVDTFSPQRTQTGQAQIDYYRKGPEAAYLAGAKKKALGGIDSGFDSAIATARAQAARSGADPTALIAGLNAKRTQASMGALTDFGMREASERERFGNAAYNLASQLTGQGLGEQSQALGQGMNLEGAIGGQAGNLAQADEARMNAGMNNLLGVLRQAGSLYGSFVPGSRAVAPPVERMASTAAPALWDTTMDAGGYPVSVAPEYAPAPTWANPYPMQNEVMPADYAPTGSGYQYGGMTLPSLSPVGSGARRPVAPAPRVSRVFLGGR